MYKKIVAIGAINVDINLQKIDRLASQNEEVVAKDFFISPGGKSRNQAEMIANLIGKGKVILLGKTAKDKFGLYKVPVDRLRDYSVETQHIDFSDKEKFPGIAFIAVSKGSNQIYYYPGANFDFTPDDLSSHESLFESASKGYAVFTLEIPLETVVAGLELATKHSMKVFLDPGGIEEEDKVERILEKEIFLIKPNLEETEILTGIKPHNNDSAKKASQKLLEKNIEYVFMTTGENGAYLFGKDIAKHFPNPDIKTSGLNDPTGAGDQAFSTIIAYLYNGESIVNACRAAMIAATLQFENPGIKPVSKQEIESYFSKYQP